ncbi:DUF1127 domain-containing protein [Paucibacter sp. APW11]|uniref:DUF1127 domain-containing protein n=1 Tax=Roseateles aquae TaxID=3077235 RepID=A0ABU3PIJ1_9BURK|nr:DUF1127 domain-containing protein [Paucibacter sp. APW11]MDT9002380.1 DUF1127 domain-containing protein [Paucibacter sp. APW11]
MNNAICPPEAARDSAPSPTGIELLLAPFYALIEQAVQRRQAGTARRALQQMDERELRDLGLGRGEIDYWT